MFYETKRYSTAGLGRATRTRPRRRSRVIAVAVPTGCLQPVGLVQDLVALGPACCSAASKKRRFKNCQNRTFKNCANIAGHRPALDDARTAWKERVPTLPPDLRLPPVIFLRPVYTVERRRKHTPKRCLRTTRFRGHRCGPPQGTGLSGSRTVARVQSGLHMHASLGGCPIFSSDGRLHPTAQPACCCDGRMLYTSSAGKRVCVRSCHA